MADMNAILSEEYVGGDDGDVNPESWSETHVFNSQFTTNTQAVSPRDSMTLPRPDMRLAPSHDPRAPAVDSASFPVHDVISFPTVLPASDATDQFTSATESSDTSSGSVSDDSFHTVVQGPLAADTVTSPQLDYDLVNHIKGMYRILDLISEQGSSGLVDKVIISQEPLGRLINDLQPGAYSSMTKVDFAALDSLNMRPVGIYGSKSEIVRFLEVKGAVDELTALALRGRMTASPHAMTPTLRSGLYLLRVLETRGNAEVFYVIYWPEEGTWDANEFSTSGRNRVTFMRYLTKLADQLICLIAEEDASRIAWKEGLETHSLDFDEDEQDRMFTFEVAKTHEQEESATSRPGFCINMPPGLGDPKRSRACPRNVDRAKLEPRLIPGDMEQGILEVAYIQAFTTKRDLLETKTEFQLRSMIENDSIQLGDSTSHETLEVMIRHGLRSRASRECEIYSEALQNSKNNSNAFIQAKERDLRTTLEANRATLTRMVHRHIASCVSRDYPTIEISALLPADLGAPTAQDSDINFHQNQLAIYPRIKDILSQLENRHLYAINKSTFAEQKRRIISLDIILRECTDIPSDKHDELIKTVLARGLIRDVVDILDENHSHAKTRLASFIPQTLRDMFSSGNGALHVQFADASERATRMDDADFLSLLRDIRMRGALLADAATVAERLAIESLVGIILKQVRITVARIETLQEDECNRQIKREAMAQLEQERGTARYELLRSLADKLLVLRMNHTLHILCVEQQRRHGTWGDQYHVSGEHIIRADACLKYTIHPLSLTAEDKQRMQLDAAHVPTPRFPSHSAISFQLPVEHNVLHIRLLSNPKVLIIVDDCRGNIRIFLENTTSLNGALNGGAPKKVLYREKVGDHCLFAFDEEKRRLAVVASSSPTELMLHILQFDEDYASLRSRGIPVNLSRWYDEAVSIVQMIFVCGTEELVMVDSDCQARVFSLVTQQFRPASLDLETIPESIHSTPDGSCVLILQASANKALILQAYHWSKFGSNRGIDLELPVTLRNGLVVTSFMKRSNTYAIGLELATQNCLSIALDITCQATEFTFQEKNRSQQDSNSESNGTKNCFIDCHGEVWTRFPIVPAVQRQTITMTASRAPRHLLFVTPLDHKAYAPYFADLMHKIERSTRKPTGDDFHRIDISAVTFEEFPSLTVQQETPSFKVGEWVVDLLCLIPIHIAVARDNRFIPLKDGVYSAEFEQSLLGADVAQIIDHLSFGWYESVFSSYMATKQVKVISSMGEQSVGKSYALNHLLDTSFAGSAMRTTEGVWMAVVPLNDIIIIALDFEGVHSIERSAQEDTLLVLFNTAISNLVLFRNNFALSRDIAGLFKSFQSSSNVLDPSANPTLFRSTLVIIIKDVIDSDKNEIVKEFSLKFQHIVQLEQASNFISRLHAGQLVIVPWPVIESRQFYTLFQTLKRRLDVQDFTHPGGSIFLQTLKTLMAKLKANDWGALSQNMASHRARLLSTLLPNALSFGASEMSPAFEPLVDFDSGIAVGDPSPGPELFLSEDNFVDRSRDKNAVLVDLMKSWNRLGRRSEEHDDAWVKDLGEFLNQIVQSRIDRVEKWLSVNTVRYPPTHAGIQDLKRAANSMFIELKANVQLCGLQCTSCHLSCILVRHHDAKHNCGTSHQCVRLCQFDDHTEGEPCGLLAGHPGQHVCDINAHLCGKPCVSENRRGCLKECTKVANHEDEGHMCSATVHECGKPCALVNIVTIGHAGETYSCKETCRIPSHEPHEVHSCGDRQCSLQCQLCRRLCINSDHLHGLRPGELHLCGQEHACPSLCAEEGICHIDTAPQSIEATFTGQHETFQYTKYSQVSRRLPCAIPIFPGKIDHIEAGPHRHIAEGDSFHFCEVRCNNCGYFCTLPRGHPQNQHETSHGSMSKTQWAIEGPEGTTRELGGRRFGSTDEGAPMLCSLVCRSLGRHVHIDYCRTAHGEICGGTEQEHIEERMWPRPDDAKDRISHSLFWKRTGFKDPYPHEDQMEFALCDAMCPGPEHTRTPTRPAQPSFCTLPILHPRQDLPPQTIVRGIGYTSQDGHSFSCQDPTRMEQAFHIIFTIDRSSSMGDTDRGPLRNRPSTALISRHHNNRLGAVYSSLHAFWHARAATTGHGQGGRRDAYTILLFDRDVSDCLVHDFSHTPDQLLDAVLQHMPRFGTNFSSAIQRAESKMEQFWSGDRLPVLVFLSDGECGIPDEVVESICQKAINLGHPLSFHSVAFGTYNSTLRGMARIALNMQNQAQANMQNRAPKSTYTQALSTVQLAGTFLQIEESLRKPRGSLLQV